MISTETTDPIAARFQHLRQKGEKALVLFVTAGDPSLDALPDIVRSLQEAGADMIEIGLPFSDPIADGPTIQASSQRALDRGVTPLKVLELLTGARCEIPLVLMGYYNTLLRAGLDKFAEQTAKAGATGTIISDLTPEESAPWVEASKKQGLSNIFLAAPTSTDSRLDEVVKRASGFLYAVSRTGVTGNRAADPEEVKNLVHRIKRRTDLPVCVGFGISKPEHVRMVCEVADGAVVGSWVVDQLAANWADPQARSTFLTAVRELKEATRG